MRTSIKNVFWNAADRRLRLPWRFVVAAIVFGIVSLAAAFSLRPVLVSVFVGLQFASFGRLGTLLFQTSLQLVVVVLFTYLVGRFIDRRRFADFGLHLSRSWWLDFGFGLALGAALMTAIFLIELALGWIRVTGTFQTVSGLSFVLVFCTSVLLFLFVGISEELLVRGYLLTNLAEGFRWLSGDAAVAIATLCSSVLFGIGHVFNPNATLTSTFVIVLAGIMLAFGYLLTGELGLSIGLHVSWNLFQTSVYGFSVSGLRLPVTVVATEQVGPRVFTGGLFGPEAGLLGVGAIVVGTVTIAWWVHSREARLSLCSSVWTPELR
ncbi:lysostaphin resistance A-like protein [Haladaptatus pallidirubidus]|uniref:Type II CAAX endopeptidase family protein n=1 Tax=Haladaptatus pallidirubidus TaxID=1008152 RepID=A0AAV3URT6_9EURY|nr:type II CAAX endopeptidase family protein [Haladaptatus pallidirubidus]